MPDEPRWRRYLRFWRPNIAEDIDEELRFHIEERVDELVARGLDPVDARREALRLAGDLEGLKAVCRSVALDQERNMRRTEWLDAFKHDVTYAVRGLRNRPGFAAAMVLTVALGIGATTALFSVVNAVILQPLPYSDAHRLVLMRERVGRGEGLSNVAVGAFVDWTEQSSVFAATAASRGMTYNLTDDEPARYAGARVTPRYFDVLHATPAVGRYFAPDETEAARVVVLSHSLWQSRFNGDVSVVGKAITLNGEKHTVIGVAPAAHSLTPDDEKLWTVLSFTPQQRANYGSHIYRAVAKLKSGVTLEQARAEIARISEGISAREVMMKDRSAALVPYRDAILGDYDTQLWVLLGAVTVVLMIACVNVASLLLARATTRRKEVAIRGALGGSRPRLFRQLMTESVVIAAFGGALGVFVARLGIGFLAGMGPSELPRLGEAALDANVLAFAALATLSCGILFGVAPALRATRVDLQSVLRDGGRGSRGIVRDRVRALLVAGEIGVTLVLLVAATLFLRSAHRLSRVDLGFEPSGVTMLRVALPADRYDSTMAIHTAFSRMVQDIRAIPGVETAGAGTRVPMYGTSFELSLRVQSQPEKGESFFGNLRMVTPGYLETLGAPVRRGRSFQQSDLVPGAPPVVIVNETFAKRTFGDANPIGQRVSGWTAGQEPEWRVVIGVIADVRASGRDRDVPGEVYAPHTQARLSWWNSHQRNMTIVAKAAQGVAVATSMREAIRRIDPQLPVFDVQPLDNVVARSTAARRFNTTLLTMLGVTGLVLAAIGIYGVIAFFVNQRTHEIGVRVALGAQTWDVVRIVIREAVGLAFTGVIVGAIAAAWATRVLESMLFEVKASDPLAFVIGTVVLFIVVLGASLLPARRAARIDPMRALAG